MTNIPFAFDGDGQGICKGDRVRIISGGHAGHAGKAFPCVSETGNTMLDCRIRDTIGHWYDVPGNTLRRIANITIEEDPNMTDRPTCESCPHFHEGQKPGGTGVAPGECRKRAPSLAFKPLGRDGYAPTTSWARVEADSWCGEHPDAQKIGVLVPGFTAQAAALPGPTAPDIEQPDTIPTLWAKAVDTNLWHLRHLTALGAGSEPYAYCQPNDLRVKYTLKTLAQLDAHRVAPICPACFKIAYGEGDAPDLVAHPKPVTVSRACGRCNEVKASDQFPDNFRPYVCNDCLKTDDADNDPRSEETSTTGSTEAQSEAPVPTLDLKAIDEAIPLVNAMSPRDLARLYVAQLNAEAKLRRIQVHIHEEDRTSPARYLCDAIRLILDGMPAPTPTSDPKVSDPLGWAGTRTAVGMMSREELTHMFIERRNLWNTIAHIEAVLADDDLTGPETFREIRTLVTKAGT